MADPQTYIKRSISRDQNAFNEYNKYANNQGAASQENRRSRMQSQSFDSKLFEQDNKENFRIQSRVNQRNELSPFKQGAQLYLKPQSRELQSQQKAAFQNNLNNFYGVSNDRNSPMPQIKNISNEIKFQRDQNNDHLQKKYSSIQNESAEIPQSIWKQQQSRNIQNQSYSDLYSQQYHQHSQRQIQQPIWQINSTQIVDVSPDRKNETNYGVQSQPNQNQQNQAKMIQQNFQNNSTQTMTNSASVNYYRYASRGIGIKELHASIPKTLDNRWSYMVKDQWSKSREIRFREGNMSKDHPAVRKDMISKPNSVRSHLSSLKSDK